MKRAILAVISPLLLVLSPMSVSADHHAHYHDTTTCHADQDLPGRCGHCPDRYAFSLWANYCNEKKTCFKRRRGLCHGCSIPANNYRVPQTDCGTCQTNVAHDEPEQQYPDPSVSVPAEATPMINVPLPQDGEVVIPEENASNDTELRLDEPADDVQQELEIPAPLEDQVPNVELDSAPPEPIKELDGGDEKPKDRSAWRRPSFLRFRSKFGL